MSQDLDVIGDPPVHITSYWGDGPRIQLTTGYDKPYGQLSVEDVKLLIKVLQAWLKGAK